MVRSVSYSVTRLHVILPRLDPREVEAGFKIIRVAEGTSHPRKSQSHQMSRSFTFNTIATPHSVFFLLI